MRAGRTSTCHWHSWVIQWLFMKQLLLHHIVYLWGSRPHIPAGRCFLSVLPIIAAISISRAVTVMKGIEDPPVHTPRETLVSLWLLAQSISPTYRELSDVDHILSCAPLRPGVNWEYIWHTMACFQLCLSRPFPCAFGSRGAFSVWLLECAHRKSAGFLQLFMSWELHWMAFLWVTDQCVPTWVSFIWSLLGH